MANRSDFYSAKVPRTIKRMLALNYPDAHERGMVRRMFIEAHKAHVAYKAKRKSDDAVVTVED